MAIISVTIDGFDYASGFTDGYKKGLEDATQVFAPEEEIESELNKNGIYTPNNGEEEK
jgi:hypothetical protein